MHHMRSMVTRSVFQILVVNRLLAIFVIRLKHVSISCLMLCLSAVCFGQNKQPVLLFQNQDLNLAEIIEVVENQTNMRFSYSADRIPLQTDLDLTKAEYIIQDLMDEIGKSLAIEYKIRNNKRILLLGQEQQNSQAQITTVVSGIILDGLSGEPLFGATITNKNRDRGVNSNEIGLFRFQLSDQEDSLIVSYIGFAPLMVAVQDIIKSTTKIQLKPNIEFDEILIRTPNARKLETESNFNYYLNKSQLSEGFGFVGSDPLNSVMQMSGIHSGREGQKSIYVRGGSPDQNLMLMDGVPLYETSHVFGLSSIFNVDAVKNVQVYKHAYPAKYGGRLSSIIDFKMNEGNAFERKSSIGFSPLSMHLNTEGPLVIGKTSYNLSARKSLVNIFYNEPIERLLDFDDSDFSFYDLNLKLSHEIEEGNKVYFNYYRGRDQFEIFKSDSQLSDTRRLDQQSFDKLNWGNNVFSFQWQNNVSERMFSKFGISASDYTYNARSGFDFQYTEKDEVENNSLDISAVSRIIDLGINTEFQFFISNQFDLTFGTGIYHHRFNPTLKQSNVYLDGTVQEFANDAPFISADEISAFVDTKWHITDKLSLQSGLRFNSFYVREKNYLSLQPRLTLNQKIGNHQQLTVSATKMTQFVHLLVNPGIGLPTELWIPSTDRLPPENAYQLALAYGGGLTRNLRFEIAGYVKKMTNVVEYISPFDLFFTFVNFDNIAIKFDANRDWENFVQSGDSHSKGLEFSLKKITGPLFFDVSYVLSKTDRTFDGLNEGNPFPYRYDRTHDFSISGSYYISKNVNFHAHWVYGTGDAFTLANEAFLGPDGVERLRAPSRNNARLADYHRLDVGIQAVKELRSTRLTLDLSVFNAYNRKNTYYEYQFENTVEGQFEREKVSLFPIMPHFSLNLEF